MSLLADNVIDESKKSSDSARFKEIYGFEPPWCLIDADFYLEDDGKVSCLKELQ